MSFMRCAVEHMTRGEFPWRLMYMVQHGAATATVPRTRSTGSAPPTRGHDIEQEEGAADRAVEISGQKHIPVVLYGDGSFQVEPSVVDIQNKLKELGLLG